MLNPSTQTFLAQASASQVRDFLLEQETDCGAVAMRWLQAQRPAVFNEALCLVYDVWCYRVGDTCFRDQEPAENHDKWFVSTDALSDLGVLAEAIPLADTEMACHELAVQRLALQNRFFAVDVAVAA